MVKRALSALLILIMLLTSFSFVSCTPNNTDDPNAPVNGETPDDGDDLQGDGEVNDGNGGNTDSGNAENGGNDDGIIELPRDEFN